ncbi:MAG: hypothetical protein ACD_71C00213G0002 [uncultured bacterium (gcode 4)]|uniref:DUF305 domain-containing protein n=1 Tax=uncultured bacterium (gcode 4) TaxID=1234023 RepID=K1Z3W0_9BACT|nr:MAG: hypothetical protein ACD_71C00213G0002 [uncultured bacterium (gcode 4)]
MDMNSSMENKQSYGRLALMAVLSFISMFVLMYAMVNIFSNVYINYNQFYMTGLMTAPMIIIELLLMRMMYRNKKWNIVISIITVIIFVFCWLGIRQQADISDKQFLKSMIPHHASALLMCSKASLQDSEIKELCKNILSGQQKEIDQMKMILERLEK